MINRRDFLGMTAGASAALAFNPQLLRALQRSNAEVIQRAIPSTGEMLPVVSFAPRAEAEPAMKEILRTLLDNGGRVVDVLHGGPAGEQAARTAARELGIQNQLFWTTPLQVMVPVLPGHAGPPPTVDRAAVRAAMEEKFATFNTPHIDLVMVSAGVDIPTHLAVLREMKKEGRVRYIGVHELLIPAPTATDRLESIMRSEQIDFIGADYSVGDRRLEKVLPLAQERNIAVMAYFPFDRSRIFQRASSTPLPEWAAEFDATTWAQFFLKYVLGHPAVTVARTGTSKPHHMLDNIGGGTGRLPDEAMRKRMAQLVDSFPPTPAPRPPQQPPQRAPQAAPFVLPAALLDRYAGEYRYAAAKQTVTIRREGDRLLMKISGNYPEGPLVALSETQFRAPWGAPIEFQLDGQGNVTGAIVRNGPYNIPLERK